MRRAGGRTLAILAALLLLVFGLAWWNRQALVRAVIVAVADRAAHVALSFDGATLTLHRAAFENVRVASRTGEPIASISHLELTYNLRDLFPGGKRLFGLESVTVDRPHVTIVRHRDGTFNVPLPQQPVSANNAQLPLIAGLRVSRGQVTVVNESANAPAGHRRLLLQSLDADAAISTAAASRYRVAFDYSENGAQRYPVLGIGALDARSGANDQHWTAAALPIASAADFIVNSPSLQLHDGVLHGVDARIFALPGSGKPHVAASAMLANGRLAVSGVSRPVEGVSGPVDVYDDGLTTPGLSASLSGVTTHVSGGIYGLRDPQLRLTIAGTGDLASLRGAFAQARALPLHGPLAFSLLVEGGAKDPVTWVDVKSPHVTYAGTAVTAVRGLAAFDSAEADVVAASAAYGSAGAEISGRVGFNKRADAVRVVARVHAPPSSLPLPSSVVPPMTLVAVALADAQDLKAIGASGVLWGSGRAAQLDGTFAFDGAGRGSLGPLRLGGAAGSAYARVAFDRPHDLVVGLARIDDYGLPNDAGSANATFFGGKAGAVLGVTLAGSVASKWGAASVQGRIASHNGTLEGALLGRVNDEASYGASISGRLNSPRVSGTVVVADGRYRQFAVNGNAGIAFADGTLRIQDAAVALGPLFVGAAGTVSGVVPRGAFSPRYDLAAQLHSSDVSALVGSVRPSAAKFVDGSVDADMRVTGSGTNPSFSGAVNAPEGSVNGLSFRSFTAGVQGNREGVTLRDSAVTVGSTRLALDGRVTPGSADVAVDAPRADLADFNDFFDAGDVLAGTGSLNVRASARGTQLVASSGEAHLAGARFRRIALGSVAADWHDAHGSIAGNVALRGSGGDIDAAGTLAPASKAFVGRVAARQMDLSVWLPMLGYPLPITGRLDAQTTIAGSYPNLSMDVHAAVTDGTAWRLPVERFEITAAASGGRGTIRSAQLEVPSLTATASGTFGLHPSDPLALSAHLISPNAGDFLDRLTGKKFGVSGALDSTLLLHGTRDAPQLRDTFVLRNLARGDLTVPRVAAEIDADSHAMTVSNGEVDFTRGRALLSARVPVRRTSTSVALGEGPIAAMLTAQDVELTNFASLLPKGSVVAGRADGSVAASGTLDAPRLEGTLALRDGSFNGPIERAPITGVGGTLAFAGNRATLQSEATVGGGRLTAQATAEVENLRRISGLRLDARANAQNARFDIPGYFAGNVDADVAVVGSGAAPPKVSGRVAVSSARIPLNAFLNQKGGVETGSALPDVAFAGLRIEAGNNVRVQSGNVDIGATGDVAVGGSLRAPTLAGSFRSTGGSLNFYRSFNIERGLVSFSPTSGLVPDVDAVATTFVSDPATAIRLHVTGPVSNMDLALTSEPSYSRQQILGLLVGAQQFGAVAGVNSTGSSSFSASSAAQQLALGQANTVFTRYMLEPLSASLASSLGFSSLQLTSNLQTGLGVNAVKAFGKNVNAIFTQTFGYPKTQAVTLEAHPNASIALRGTWYTADGPALFGAQPPQTVGSNALNLNPATQLPTPTGTNGVSFSFVQKFP